MPREDPEMVTLQLHRGGRQIGEPFSAHLDWRVSGSALKEQLVQAVRRAGFGTQQIGEFELEVREHQKSRVLTRFVATWSTH